MNAQLPHRSQQIRRHVFISYSSKDRAAACKVANYLESQDIRCWMDDPCIKPGAPWRNTIECAIRESDAFILLLSDHANQSEEVRREVNLAADHRKRVIAVCVGSKLVLPEGDLRYVLAGKQIPLLDPRHERETLEALARSILDPNGGTILPSSARHWYQHPVTWMLVAVALNLFISWLIFGLRPIGPLLPHAWPIVLSTIGTVITGVAAFYMCMTESRRTQPRILRILTCYAIAFLILAACRIMERSWVVEWNPTRYAVLALCGAEDEERVAIDDRLLRNIHGPVDIRWSKGAFLGRVIVPPRFLLSERTRYYLDEVVRYRIGDHADPVKEALSSEAAAFIQDHLEVDERLATASLSIVYALAHLLGIAALGLGHGGLGAVLTRI